MSGPSEEKPGSWPGERAAWRANPVGPGRGAGPCMGTVPPRRLEADAANSGSRTGGQAALGTGVDATA